MDLRWATWNVWALGPEWIVRLDAARRTLEPLDLDLICLQEVRRDGDLDGAAHLADRLGLHLARTPDGHDPGAAWWSRRAGADVRVDNVVLARWAFDDIAVQNLPSTPGPGHSPGEVRTALHVRIDAPEPLRVVSTQLTSSPLQSRGRVEQVRALAGELARRRRPDESVLVAGDLNAEPDADEIRLFCGHKTAPPVDGHVLLDLWRFADPAVEGATWDRANPHVAATGEPTCRIDYLLAAPLPSGRLPTVHAVARFGEVPLDGIWPSDHAGVTATLRLGPEP